MHSRPAKVNFNHELEIYFRYSKANIKIMLFLYLKVDLIKLKSVSDYFLYII